MKGSRKDSGGGILSHCLVLHFRAVAGELLLHSCLHDASSVPGAAGQYPRDRRRIAARERPRSTRTGERHAGKIRPATSVAPPGRHAVVSRRVPAVRLPGYSARLHTQRYNLARPFRCCILMRQSHGKRTQPRVPLWWFLPASSLTRPWSHRPARLTRRQLCRSYKEGKLC